MTDQTLPAAESADDDDFEEGVSLSRYAQPLALLAASIATCGSLFFSEVLGWTPCELCWYQRILMYPIAVILLVAALRRDSRVATYVLPLSLLGILVSLYHYLIQKTTFLPVPACSITVPCTADYLDLFGVITIPMLAFIAFVIISIAMIVSLRWPAAADHEALQEADEQGTLARFGLDRVLALGIVLIVVVWFVAAAQLF